MLDIYLVQIDKTLEAPLFKSLIESLPADEQASVNKKVRQTDKESALITRVFLRKLLAENYRLSPAEIVFSKNEYGKPFLPSQPDLHFNISHSGGYIAYTFSDSPVGIDVEIERGMEPETLANFLHPRENDFLFNSAGADKQEMFRIWTLKESYIKAIGMGMYKELTSFSVVSRSGLAELSDANPANVKNWRLSHKLIADKTHLSICCDRDCPEPAETCIKLSDIDW